jgi:hypothetical protein
MPAGKERRSLSSYRRQACAAYGQEEEAEYEES